MASENIEGTATDANGNTLQDAVIALFLANKNATDGDQNTVQYTRTDSNGFYSIDDHPDSDGTSQEWHVAGYYQDGTGEFNALSKPSVAASVGPAIPDSGVARYEFEQDVADSWNNNGGNDLTSVGYTTDAVVGEYAKESDGSGDLVTVSSIQFDDTDDFSLTGWFKYDTGGDTSTKGLIAQRDGYSTSDFGVFLSSNSNLLAFAVGESNGTVNIQSANGKLSTGTYYFFAATKSGDTYTLYLDDAEQIGQQTNSGGWTTSETFTMGALNSNGSASLSGSFDDYRIYNKELTSTEVSNLYNTGSI